MVVEILQESETIELKKSLSELKEGLVSIAAMLNKPISHMGVLMYGSLMKTGNSAPKRLKNTFSANTAKHYGGTTSQVSWL
jgi:hypothetical protein